MGYSDFKPNMHDVEFVKFLEIFSHFLIHRTICTHHIVIAIFNSTEVFRSGGSHDWSNPYLLEGSHINLYETFQNGMCMARSIFNCQTKIVVFIFLTLIQLMDYIPVQFSIVVPACQRIVTILGIVGWYTTKGRRRPVEYLT